MESWDMLGWREWKLTFLKIEFSKFHSVLDSEIKRLQASGLETGQGKAEVISYEDEELMWEKESWVMIILSLY